MNLNLRLKVLCLFFCIGLVSSTKAQTLLSLNKTATASTTEGSYNASNAVDASGTTFWSSLSTNYIQTLTVDLGQDYDVDYLQINFSDGRYAVTFDIMFSTDGTTWKIARTIPPTNTSSSIWIYGLPGTARYVRFNGRGRANSAGYRISDFKIYGYSISTSTQIASMNTVSNRLLVGYSNSEMDDLSVYVSSMQANGKWPDLAPAGQPAIPGSMNYSGNSWASHPLRMCRLAQAYSNPANSLYHNTAIPGKIMLGFRHLMNKRYTSTAWYDTTVRVPNYLIVGLMLMKNVIPKDSIYAYAGFIRDNTDKPNNRGANRAWVAGITTRKGLVIDRYQVAKRGFENLAIALDIAGPSLQEGIRIDSSFHQHRDQVQSGSYGQALVVEEVNYVRFADGTVFSTEFNTTQRENLRNMMLGGSQLLGYRNSVDFGTVGRDISRVGGTLNIDGAVLDQQKLNDPSKAARYQSWKDNLTGAVYPVVGAKFFWESAILSSRGPNYYLSAKVISKRTKGTEALNGENLKGYNLPFGATNIMTNGDEYYDIFPTWNWSRIPGTTAEMSEAATSTSFGLDSGYVKGFNSFAGGVSVNEVGTIAYEHTNYRGLSAKKAYFFMENMMLCLGNGITASKSNEVVTTVNQTKAVGSITYNSPSTVLSVDSLTSNTINWVNHNNVGYLFPTGGYLTVTNKNQSGTWRSINNGGTTTVQNTQMFNLYVRHSATPSNRTYYYIVAPNKSASDMTALSSGHGFTVESNTASIQAIRHAATNQYAVVFYVAGQITMPDGLVVKSDKKAIVMIRKYSTTYRISVEDPEYTGSTIKITLNVNLTGTGAVYTAGETAITVPLGTGDEKGKPFTSFYSINGSSLMAQSTMGTAPEAFSEKEDLHNQTVTLYPNPANNVVKVSGISDHASITVYDLLGRQYKTITGNSVEISGLSKGIYLLKINDQGKLYTKKFIKD